MHYHACWVWTLLILELISVRRQLELPCSRVNFENFPPGVKKRVFSLRKLSIKKLALPGSSLKMKEKRNLALKATPNQKFRRN